MPESQRVNRRLLVTHGGDIAGVNTILEKIRESRMYLFGPRFVYRVNKGLEWSLDPSRQERRRATLELGVTFPLGTEDLIRGPWTMCP